MVKEGLQNEKEWLKQKKTKMDLEETEIAGGKNKINIQNFCDPVSFYWPQIRFPEQVFFTTYSDLSDCLFLRNFRTSVCTAIPLPKQYPRQAISLTYL